MTCAEQQFSGQNGSGDVQRKPEKPLDNPTTEDPVDSGTVTTDDDGKVALVDAELKIDRLPDSAAWQNCLYAHIVGQPVIELGCNRTAPKNDNRPPLVQNIRLKLKTNECNQLRVYFKTNSGRGLYDNVSTVTPNRIFSGTSKNETGAAGPGINVIREAGGSILIEANDNSDRYWHDVYLRITPPAGKSNLKFTIENSGLPCN
jgi:hypothetical protein